MRLLGAGGERGVAMLALVGLELRDARGKRRIAVAQRLELLGIMGVDLVLDRGGAGHRRLRADQGGGGAERVAGDRPERLEHGRADAALGEQRVEMPEMLAAPARPCRRSAPEDGWRSPSTASWPA